MRWNLSQSHMALSVRCRRMVENFCRVNFFGAGFSVGRNCRILDCFYGNELSSAVFKSENVKKVLSVPRALPAVFAPFLIFYEMRERVF